MRTERKVFSFLGFKVLVELRDTAPRGYSSEAIGGCQDEPDEDGVFYIWFTGGLPGLKAMVHETYHLFMTIMRYADTHEHSFGELNNEIYAYNFHLLFSEILEALFSMKRYQKALEEATKEEAD